MQTIMSLPSFFIMALAAVFLPANCGTVEAETSLLSWLYSPESRAQTSTASRLPLGFLSFARNSTLPQWWHLNRSTERNIYSEHGLPTLHQLPSLLDDCVQDAVKHTARASVTLMRDGRRMSLPERSFLLGNTPTNDTLNAIASGNVSVKLELEHLIGTSVPSIQHFAADVEKEYHITTTQHVYVSGPNSQALPFHADPYDVLVLQLDGEKEWSVCPEAAAHGGGVGSIPHLGSSPLDSVGRAVSTADVPDMDPVDNMWGLGASAAGFGCMPVRLRRGDLLHIRQGVVHAARTTSATSMHLTLGIQLPPVPWQPPDQPHRSRRECTSSWAGSSCDCECTFVGGLSGVSVT